MCFLSESEKMSKALKNELPALKNRPLVKSFFLGYQKSASVWFLEVH